MSTELGNRAALIEAMARCCAERGYEDTRIADVLAATGLSRGAFDHEFKSKEECAIAAVDTVLAEGIAIVSNAFSGDTAEGESVLRALVALLHLFAEKPHMGSLAMTDSRQRMPRAAFERYAGGFSILIAVLDRLRSDSLAGAEAPPNAARGALGGAEALIRQEMARGRAAALPTFLPDLIYSAVVPFLGQEEALRLTRQACDLLDEMRVE